LAIVILSPEATAESRVRTISVRQLVVGVLLLGVLTLVAGFGAGYILAVQEAPPPPIQVPQVDLEGERESRFLISQVGELSGRMMRLESEANLLAKRIGLKRERNPKAAKEAATPPKGAVPAEGGPLIPAVGESLSDVIELPESPLADAGFDLDALERDLNRLEAHFNLLDEMAAQKSVLSMVYPNRLPVAGSRVGSRFGNRVDPFNKHRAFHSGLDFPAPRGTPIRAAAGGLVTYAAYRGDYGKQVEIDHGNGLVTRYSHASRLRVKPGTVVTPGQHIGDIGSTGRSTGPHLHFEVLKEGRFVDPEAYLNAG